MIIKEGYHDKVKLEASYNPTNDIEFYFFRNGIYVGFIRHITGSGYLDGFGVRRSFQGTGLGKAMLHYAFQKTRLPEFHLVSSANAFYHKVGGDRRGKYDFVIKREKLKPSSIKFEDISFDQAEEYRSRKNAQPMDTYPSINDSILD